MNNQTSPRSVCLVTGGSSGIGLATAQRFAAEGFHVAICGRREDKLSTAAKSIERAMPQAATAPSAGQIADPQECLTVTADLNEVDQAQHMVRQVLDQFGRIDVLVNNAATAPLAPFEEISSQTFETAINTNLRSLFYITQIAWARMKTQNRGVVINISSMAAVDPFPGFSLYGACKSWVDLLTVALAEEGKTAGQRICSVRPGAVETPLLRGLFPDFPPEQCVQPTDIADVVWGCVDQPAKYPSGGVFPVTNQPDATA